MIRKAKINHDKIEMQVDSECRYCDDCTGFETEMNITDRIINYKCNSCGKEYTCYMEV